ncbi:bifunctional phosphoserine phosphatase/homoserine phosphotransferase ThrH [Ruficoccus sp. ZRK36]|uniref:bifunctional phosphoserine phosphatase/homoserine phosphotransferase ThrH n=1 Tax=Ruficoccus sp. ZRK36 TaxID=2866311 RepID=UPI001C73B395|nr:bifunctional phosphoserine phosphatase/homoserine phosphotransferase ThrH [Ruficoccus sp. ZRK36]QYY35706.1 bifunctional phosphoserine phosphatase/homoserine phosphotransferase ThrH [Ruficoccus sp. ZRK36]
MKLVCLDLEGVLIPEIWMAVAEKTGVEGLRRTTRDEPDYDVLMNYRLGLLAEHDIRLPLIQEVIGTLSPLPGAKEFTAWLKSVSQVIILSDTFAQFAAPLMRQLDYPTLFCHELVVDPEGRITGYALRQNDQKRKAIEAFRSLNFETIASGDSYNDLSMIQSADHGILFRPSDAFAAEYPEFPVTREHAELRAEIEKHL